MFAKQVFKEEEMLRRLFSLSLLFLIACSAGITSTTPATVPVPLSTTPATVPVSLSSTLPPKPISIPSPTPFGVQNDDTSIYILLDASYSSGNFQETRNQIAGFFYTLATRYLGISPQVYSFGGQKNDVLTKIDGYSGIQELKRSSNLGDFYSEAIQKGWKYLQNETKPRRFLIILVEGSFYSDQEKENLRQKVNDIVVKNLREADSIYFLVMNQSQFEWWKNNLGPIKHIYVLDASDSMKSIKEVAREIFGEKIRWLSPGKWEPVSLAKFSRQQLSAVLLNPKNTIEVELVGGGLQPLSGGWNEENFRQSTYSESNSPARLLLKSPSGLAAYWITDINFFQIENLSIDRSIDNNCTPTKKCLKIKVTFSLNPASSVTSNKAILSAKNGNFSSDEIHTLVGGGYYINFRWESENEPENMQFSVEHGESIVFGPVNVVPYPIIVSARASDETQEFPSGDSHVNKEYRILEIEFWFLSQQEPDQVNGCDIQKNTSKEAPASYWGRDANTLKIHLLKEKPCQSFSITFQSEPISITCDISDNKSLELECREQEERRKQ